jgi:hypothetical protein
VFSTPYSDCIPRVNPPERRSATPRQAPEIRRQSSTVQARWPMPHHGCTHCRRIRTPTSRARGKTTEGRLSRLVLKRKHTFVLSGVGAPSGLGWCRTRRLPQPGGDRRLNSNQREGYRAPAAADQKVAEPSSGWTRPVVTAWTSRIQRRHQFGSGGRGEVRRRLAEHLSQALEWPGRWLHCILLCSMPSMLQIMQRLHEHFHPAATRTSRYGRRQTNGSVGHLVGVEDLEYLQVHNITPLFGVEQHLYPHNLVLCLIDKPSGTKSLGRFPSKRRASNPGEVVQWLQGPGQYVQQERACNAAKASDAPTVSSNAPASRNPCPVDGR